MKLKGISKLVLAGTALAATAATLTTATYAWYVTNANASATGVEAKVDSAISGSLYIANDTIDSSVHKPGNYGPSITLEKAGKTGDNWTDADLAVGKYKFSDLQPQSYAKNGVYEATTVTDSTDYATKKSSLFVETATAGVFAAVGDAAYDENKTYYTQKAAPGSWVTTDGSSTPENSIDFMFWLTSDQAADASFLLMVDNKTTTPVYQKALTATGLPTTGNNVAIVKDDTFLVDAVYALRMSITKAYLEDTYEEVAVAAGDSVTGLYVLNETTYEAASGTAVANTKYYNKFTAGVAQELKTIRVAEVAKAMDGSSAYASTLTTAGQTLTFANPDGNANGYYLSAMNSAPYNYDATNNITKEKISTGDDSLSNIHIEAGKNMLLTFKIWLEGSDKDCFDSCRGQEFDFKFTFGV